MTEGDLVVVRMTGTIIEGHLGTFDHTIPKRQRWPVLYVIKLDENGSPPGERVEELHLKADEFYAL